MSSWLGVLLVHIDFSPKTCFFGNFFVDSPICTNVGYFPAYFPKLLLCYSLYTHFPQETPETKIVEAPQKEQTSETAGSVQVKLIYICIGENVENFIFNEFDELLFDYLKLNLYFYNRFQNY